MNFVGHIHVAETCRHRLGFSPTHNDELDATYPSAWLRHLLGTALPDFAAIGRFQMHRQPSDGHVRTGVDVHHATDAAFHGHRLFIEANKELASRLRALGVNRGAARACGHVGVELLIDGHLLSRSPKLEQTAQAVLDSTTNRSLNLTELVREDRRSEWARHLERISSWDVPTDYHAPHAVARRLHRILSHRPRLAFAHDQIDHVADSLSRVAPAVIADLPTLLDDVAGEVVNDLA